MKKKALIFILIAIVVAVSSCSPAPVRPIKNPDGYISVYGRPGLVSEMFDKFVELHPDFRYEIFFMPSVMTNGENPDLDSLLAEKNVDIYFAEGSDILKCTKGAQSGYAMPYEELGIDVEDEIEAADIFQYIVDTGTRPSDGKVVGLSYNSTACAFIYRRSLAKEVWGTDDPAIVKTKIGPGWDKFFEAAEELKEKGYSVDCMGPAGNSGKRWIVDGKLYISPEREAYLDYAKENVDEVYGPTDLSEVFGIFGPDHIATDILPHISGAESTWGDWAVCDPSVGYLENGVWVLANKELDNDPKKKAAVAEFIEWMTLDCTKKGLQYYWANGKLFDDSDSKRTVASVTVMTESDGTMSFLGGQDLFDAYISAGQLVDCTDITEYDAAIDGIWRKHVSEYAHGKCTRDEAIAAFKQEVKKQLGIDACN